MEEIKTWRELLVKITSDPSERQRIAEALAINPITLTRWASGKSKPRPDNLRPLLGLLPQYRQQLSELIVREFPLFFAENTLAEDGTPFEIPSAFYTRILSAHTNSPAQLRASSICILLLQQMLAHLDPQQLGMSIIVAQCVPPAHGSKVRVLRKTLGRGTSPWSSHLENRTQFFGVESQIGQAVSSAHPLIVESYEERQRLFPNYQSTFEESVAVFPILFGDRTAGSVCIASTQKNYFSPAYRDLIQSYAELMVLAFEPLDFYFLCNLELGVMPLNEVQQLHIAMFQQRVTQLLIQAAHNNQHLTRPKAELMIWQELEEELLRLSFEMPPLG